MNIPQQIKDIKLLDLPQAIKDLKFWPSHDNSVLNRFSGGSTANSYLPIESTSASNFNFNYDFYQSETTSAKPGSSKLSFSTAINTKKQKPKKKKHNDLLLETTKATDSFGKLYDSDITGSIASTSNNSVGDEHQSIFGINSDLPEKVYNKKYT